MFVSDCGYRCILTHEHSSVSVKLRAARLRRAAPPFSFYYNPAILNPKWTYMAHGKYQALRGGWLVGTCSIRIVEQENGNMTNTLLSITIAVHRMGVPNPNGAS